MTAATPMLITVTGPSGTGKDAVISGVLAQDPAIRRFVTATTRTPRPGEEHGKNYYFLTRDEFEKGVAEGDFIEHNPNYNGNMYGTPKWEVERLFGEGYDVISDINAIGVRLFEEALPQQIYKLLLLPPSRERLEQRLTGRNPDMAVEGRQRLLQIEADLGNLHNPNYTFTNPDMAGTSYANYDAVLVNDVLDHTVAEAARLIRTEREKRSRA
jgi:guanylate kinase